MFRVLVLLAWCVLLAGPLLAQTASTAALTQPEADAAGAAAVPLVYNIAEQMPAFPGGAPAFQRFLRDKIRYPEEALRKGLEGKVHVSFIIDEEGRIQDAKVVKGLGAGLDEEALRLVRIMPWWTPGRVQDQPVRVAYTLPIQFRALK